MIAKPTSKTSFMLTTAAATEAMAWQASASGVHEPDQVANDPGGGGGAKDARAPASPTTSIPTTCIKSCPDMRSLGAAHASNPTTQRCLENKMVQRGAASINCVVRYDDSLKRPGCKGVACGLLAWLRDIAPRTGLAEHDKQHNTCM